MTYQFMDDVWLRGVLRSFVVSDVLGRVENLECQAIEELSLGQ